MYETVSDAELREEIKERIAEVKEAAEAMPDGEIWWNLEHWDRDALTCVLANLNGACTHLEVIEGV
jgi:hypothetical protein